MSMLTMMLTCGSSQLSFCVFSLGLVFRLRPISSSRSCAAANTAILALLIRDHFKAKVTVTVTVTVTITVTIPVRRIVDRHSPLANHQSLTTTLRRLLLAARRSPFAIRHSPMRSDDGYRTRHYLFATTHYYLFRSKLSFFN